MSETAVPSSTPSAPSSAPTPRSAPTPSTSSSSSTPTPSAASSGPNSRFADSTPAPAAGAQTPTPPPAPSKRKYSVKVDGQSQDLELDDTEVSVRLQKALAAEKRMQQAAEERKRTQAGLDFLKSDPFSDKVKEILGVDLMELAEKRLADKYKAELEAQTLSPEERIKREYEAKLAEERREKSEIQKRIEDEKRAQHEERMWQEEVSKFESALEAEGLERSFETIYHMAELARMNMEHKLELTPQQLATEVRNRMESAQKSFQKQVLSGLKGDKLLAHLGEDVVKEILVASVARAKRIQSGVEQPPAPNQAPAPDAAVGEDEKYSPEKRSLSSREFRRWARR